MSVDAGIVLGYLDAVGRGDFATAGTALADDVEWVLPRSLSPSGPLRGRERVLQVASRTKALFAEQPVSTIRNLLDAGGVVAIEIAAQGTTAAGEPYANTYAFFCNVRDGRIVSVREYVDTVHLRGALLGERAATSGGQPRT